jgi:endonuclease/exonuclease/phosphatase family metal-dependent hydrolase
MRGLLGAESGGRAHERRTRSGAPWRVRALIARTATVLLLCTNAASLGAQGAPQPPPFGDTSHVTLHAQSQPATPFRTPGDLSDLSLEIVSYNIRHGRGMDDRVDLPRIAAVLRAQAPDIVGLQEVDQRVTRSGGAPQADSLGPLLGMHAAFGAFMPYQGGEYGLGILSKHPIVTSRAIRLPDGNEPRVALLAEIALPGHDTIAVVNVHFDWVQNDTLRFAQAAALTRVLDTLSRPWVLLGDFNDRPGSRTLALFTSRATEARKPASDHFTFSSTEPTQEIDFIFAAPTQAWRVGEARVITEPMASDHRPVRATVTRRAPHDHFSRLLDSR